MGEIKLLNSMPFVHFDWNWDIKHMYSDTNGVLLVFFIHFFFGQIMGNSSLELTDISL